MTAQKRVKFYASQIIRLPNRNELNGKYFSQQFNMVHNCEHLQWLLFPLAPRLYYTEWIWAILTITNASFPFYSFFSSCKYIYLFICSAVLVSFMHLISSRHWFLLAQRNNTDEELWKFWTVPIVNIIMLRQNFKNIT